MRHLLLVLLFLTASAQADVKSCAVTVVPTDPSPLANRDAYGNRLPAKPGERSGFLSLFRRPPRIPMKAPLDWSYFLHTFRPELEELVSLKRLSYDQLTELSRRLVRFEEPDTGDQFYLLRTDEVGAEAMNGMIKSGFIFAVENGKFREQIRPQKTFPGRVISIQNLAGLAGSKTKLKLDRAVRVAYALSDGRILELSGVGAFNDDIMVQVYLRTSALVIRERTAEDHLAPPAAEPARLTSGRNREQTREIRGSIALDAEAFRREFASELASLRQTGQLDDQKLLELPERLAVAENVRTGQTLYVLRLDDEFPNEPTFSFRFFGPSKKYLQKDELYFFARDPNLLRVSPVYGGPTRMVSHLNFLGITPNDELPAPEREVNEKYVTSDGHIIETEGISETEALHRAIKGVKYLPTVFVRNFAYVRKPRNMVRDYEALLRMYERLAD